MYFLFSHQTIVTPVMKTYFDYDDFGNSVLYLLGGIELLLVSLLMTIISRRVSDRSFIFVGLVLNIVTYVWMLIVMPRFEKGNRANIPYFGVGVVLDLASIPIILDIGISLATKLVKDEVQGFATGVRRLFGKYVER